MAEKDINCLIMSSKQGTLSKSYHGQQRTKITNLHKYMTNNNNDGRAFCQTILPHTKFQLSSFY